MRGQVIADDVTDNDESDHLSIGGGEQTLRSIHRQGSLLGGWCEQCDKQVAIILLEEVALAGLSIEVICRQVEVGNLHFVADADGPLLICLNSLLE